MTKQQTIIAPVLCGGLGARVPLRREEDTQVEVWRRLLRG